MFDWKCAQMLCPLQTLRTEILKINWLKPFSKWIMRYGLGVFATVSAAAVQTFARALSECQNPKRKLQDRMWPENKNGGEFVVLVSNIPFYFIENKLYALCGCLTMPIEHGTTYNRFKASGQMIADRFFSFFSTIKLFTLHSLDKTECLSDCLF